MFGERRGRSLFRRHGINTNLLARFAKPLELHNTADQSKQSVIAAPTNVLTRVKLRAPLTNDDVARFHDFATVALDAQALSI